MNQSQVMEQPMTAEEARQVKWNRQNPRPMGELLDEGYLTKRDLEWASANAFKPLQKQAARVLLDELNDAPVQTTDPPNARPLPPELASSAFSIKLTMEQIRATEWPFPPYKGQPMGQLADKQQLTLKDLGYAVDAGRDPRVRQAAMALLLIRLNQKIQEPAPSAGLLHVVSGGRSFAERRQLLLVLIEGVLLGGIEGALLVWLIQQLNGVLSSPAKPLPPNTTPTTVVVGIIILLAIGLGILWLATRAIDLILNRIEKQIQYYRQGHEGEERVVAAIHSVLDGNWFLFRNIVLPGRNKSDLDSVLVGPSGIWLLEIKTFTSEHRNIGESWEYHAKHSWKPIRKNPGRQAKANAGRLANFLKADGIQQWVTPVVVWANPATRLQVENPSVAVWTLDRLPDELDNIWQAESLPGPKRQQIVDKLTQLCRAQREARKPA